MADVARMAGVSRSTVSYVLSGARPISDPTRERILSAMKELAYTPNALAQGLAGRRTGLIALLFPAGERGLNLTEFEYINAAAERAREDGYHLLLWPIGYDDLDEIRKVVSQGLVDGVLLMEVRTVDERVAVLSEADIPFTMIGRTADPGGLSYVDTDFEATGALAVEHLADLGHTEIVFLSQSQEYLDAGVGPFVRSRDAVVAAAKIRGMNVTVLAAPPTHPPGRDVLDRILAAAPPVTALIEINRPATLGLMGVAIEHGLSLPRDLAIVALNTSEAAARLGRPALTSVSPNHREIARLATSYLLRSLRGEDSSSFQTLVQPFLTVRESTAPARSH
ncbi:LacI family DNA-binding transcriptional regulator [Arthrobacter sp. 35W]|uniref:LacI family DNA-binding transcriptional regulator n=1 Tax=Arthrobacter sp. 35W TaxID=1132441 RepID=UPI00054D5FE9|nr:LacI family DNA-binding transcriptional regulator [Arthrobacter sp. 35W]